MTSADPTDANAILPVGLVLLVGRYEVGPSVQEPWASDAASTRDWLQSLVQAVQVFQEVHGPDHLADVEKNELITVLENGHCLAIVCVDTSQYISVVGRLRFSLVARHSYLQNGITEYLCTPI